MGKKRRNAMRIVFALLLLACPLHISAELCRFNVGSIDFFYRLPKEQHKDSQIMVLFGGRNWSGEKAIKTFNFGELADKYSLILLSPSFRDNEYWQPEKWSGNVLRLAVKSLKKKFGLKSQKLLFYGYSAGGQCANLFYNYMPKEVEAWGLHACGVYPVSTVKNGVLSFITCGLQDSDRVRISKRFIYKYRENGGKVIWKEYSGGHELNSEALLFARQFFADVLEKREAICVGEDETGAIVPISKANEIDIEFRNYLTSETLKKLWEAK